jgi:hypothetical protein
MVGLQSATSAIPLLSPVLGPVAQNFSPILAQLTASPTLRLGVNETTHCLAVLWWVFMQSVHYSRSIRHYCRTSGWDWFVSIVC